MCNQKKVFEILEALDEPVVIATAKKGVNLIAKHKSRITMFSSIGEFAFTSRMSCSSRI